MPPTQREAGYIWDMLEAAKAIQKFMTGVRFEEFLKGRKLP